MGLGTAYLVVFNFVLAAGWGAVLVPLVQAVIEQCDAGSCVGLLPFGAAAADVCVCGDLHAQVEQPLKIFQTAAVLEVLHALTGLVRAPVFTVIQVLSRPKALSTIDWTAIRPPRPPESRTGSGKSQCAVATLRERTTRSRCRLHDQHRA